MKKNYEAPQLDVVTLKTDRLLAGSEISVGGKGPAKAREFGWTDDED